MTFRLCAALLFCAALPLAAQNTSPEFELSDQSGDKNELQTVLETAEAYHEGLGVVQNYARAAELYLNAARQGDPAAQNAIGRYYYEGLGVVQDPAAARRWLKAAADQGATQHLFDYAAVIENTDPVGAADLYERASEAGHLEATVALGVMYQHGSGVAQDFEKARMLYEQGVEGDHPRAQNNLGLLYVRGDGVEQDHERAAMLFSAAAAQGLPSAIKNLSVMYANGFGVPQSDAEAARLAQLAAGVVHDPSANSEDEKFWQDPRLITVERAAINKIEQAASAGDPIAQFQLAYLLVTTPDLDHAGWRRAAVFFRRGAEKGHPQAMINLAQLYIDGRGVPQDYVLAQMWLLRAQVAGLDEASVVIANLQPRMTAKQINAAQARAAALSGE